MAKVELSASTTDIPGSLPGSARPQPIARANGTCYQLRPAMMYPELDIHRPQFGIAELLEAVNAGHQRPRLEQGTLHSWIHRGLLPARPAGGGKGRERLFPAVD